MHTCILIVIYYSINCRRELSINSEIRSSRDIICNCMCAYTTTTCSQIVITSHHQSRKFIQESKFCVLSGILGQWTGVNMNGLVIWHGHQFCSHWIDCNVPHLRETCTHSVGKMTDGQYCRGHTHRQHCTEIHTHYHMCTHARMHAERERSALIYRPGRRVP